MIQSSRRFEMLRDDRTRRERKAAHIAAALVALGIPQEEAVRVASKVKDEGAEDQHAQPQSTLAKRAATKRIKWPIRWESPGAT
jgi:hypothetical protein